MIKHIFRAQFHRRTSIPDVFVFLTSPHLAYKTSFDVLVPQSRILRSRGTVLKPIYYKIKDSVNETKRICGKL